MGLLRPIRHYVQYSPSGWSTEVEHAQLAANHIVRCTGEAFREDIQLVDLQMKH